MVILLSSCSLLVVIWVAHINAESSKVGAFCVNPAGEPGKCVPARDCDVLLHVVGQAEVSTKERQFLVKSRCGTHERRPLVCCAGPPPDDRLELPSPPECGMRATSRLIGGRLTQIDDFPWTALIEYVKPDGSNGFHCGGTLINQEHIVTAAHCVSALPDGWKVNRVRLGEWDLATVEDCEYGYCNNPVTDVAIAKIIVHSEYGVRNRSTINDIALIRFKEKVNFTDTIQPICLPLSELIRNENLTDSYSIVAGWGNSPSIGGMSKKYQVALKLKNVHECHSNLEQSGTSLPHTAQLCTTAQRSDKTICSVDAGGGLVRYFYGFYYLIGVAGIGQEKCGLGIVPGVFTGVPDYVDWIKNNIK